MNERINILYGAGVNIHVTKCPGERVLSLLSGEGRSSCSALLNTTPVSVTAQVGKWSRDLVATSNKAGQRALHSAVNANTSSTLWWSVSLHKHGNYKSKSASLPYQFLLINSLTHFFQCIYLFISLLYTFRATQYSSSWESNCINTSSGIYHSV